jgi:hypothetical protein
MAVPKTAALPLGYTPIVKIEGTYIKFPDSATSIGGGSNYYEN